ncbi:MAG: hypothetical protein Kow0020_10810 [Wenzhouxiangellaceae bacterium]
MIDSGVLLMLAAVLATTALIAALWAYRRAKSDLAEALNQASVLQSERAQAQDALARLETRLEEQAKRLAEADTLIADQRRQISAQLAEIANLNSTIAELRERLVQERKAAEEKLALLGEAREKLADAFKALSSDALRHNNESFLKLARESLERFQQSARSDLESRQKAIEQLTAPIRERLEKFDGKLDELEKARLGAYRALDTQLKALIDTHLPQLHRETADLVKALRQPQARGRWGELQLKRVVEMAGMLDHCDFTEQQTGEHSDGRRLRPDLIVHLPGGRQVIVDAKTPIDAYLQAVEAQSDEARRAALARHAAQLRQHITQLGRKDYFDQFDPTPEFVVLFVPGEAFFSAALAEDPTLIEHGAEHRVIPASPTTLIALLKAVAYGWRQEALARNAAEVAELGKELYHRIGTLAEHWNQVGRRLKQAVDAYNSSVGTLERRVLPSARKFQQLKAVGADREIASPETITHETRPLTAPELNEEAPDQDQDRAGPDQHDGSGGA